MAVETKSIKTMGKLVSVLDCFSTSERALTVGDIAARTGLPRSTAHRSINALKEVGFLDQDRRRDSYRLGLKLFQLGTTVLHSMDIQSEARPFVEALSTLTGENVHLCVFDGERMVFVESADGGATGSQNATITMELTHCHNTSVGKATLAFQPESVIDRLTSNDLAVYTEHSISDPVVLREELAKIRSQGFAFDLQEHQLNVCCVAAPIRNASGNVFAAVSVSGPLARMSEENLRSYAPFVVSHADAISRRLGYVPKSAD